MGRTSPERANDSSLASGDTRAHHHKPIVRCSAELGAAAFHNSAGGCSVQVKEVSKANEEEDGCCSGGTELAGKLE